MDGPRAYTQEECLDMFLDHVRGIARSWAQDTRVQDRTEMCEGVAFSILAMLDGCSGMMPAFSTKTSPHPEDEAYNKDQGENWWPADLEIGFTMLHDKFYAEDREKRDKARAKAEEALKAYGEFLPADKKQLTLGDLRRLLETVPGLTDETPIDIGVCDDEFNKEGGVFAPAEEAIRFHRDRIQITAWKDIEK